MTDEAQASFGPVETWASVEGGVRLNSGNERIDLNFLADGSLRLQHQVGAEDDQPPAWPAASPIAADHEPTVEETESDRGRHLRITGEHLVLSVDLDPFAIAVMDRDERHLLNTRAGDGPQIIGDGSLLRLEYPWWEQTFGFGEKTGPLDKQGESFVMWNTDAAFYDPQADPLYKSIPFWVGLRSGVAYGVLLDNRGRVAFDLGRRERDLLEIKTETGSLDLYVIPGPTPREVMDRHTALTGRPMLPPRWALGYQQCRFSYHPESRVRELAQTFRDKKIPCDTLYLDIDYMQDYRSFTWNQKSFPDPKGLLDSLHEMGFKVVVIIDPGLAVDGGYAPFAEARDGDFLVRRPGGELFTGTVWPGECAFPDFTNPAVREWWGGLYRDLVAAGVDGFWNDMNEPSVQGSERTISPDVVHRTAAGTATHREIHNLYGSEMVRATRDGILRHRPGRRPYVMTRAACSGTQETAVTWSGDNRGTWEHMRLSLRMALNMGVSGFPHYGPDIGGFADQPTPELFLRWLQLGAFFGVMRTHSCLNSPDQEPWSFGPAWEERNRRAIELRYRMLPLLYSLVHDAHRTGAPPMRPLWVEDPGEYSLAQVDDQFLLGPDLLVAPALSEGCAYRKITLPPGIWYRMHDGRRLEGGRTLAVSAALDDVPMFARAGAFIPWQKIVQHTSDAPDPALTVKTYVGEHGSFVLMDDAGDGPADAREIRCTRMTMRVHAAALDLFVDLIESSSPGSFGLFLFRVTGLPGPPVAVLRNGADEHRRDHNVPTMADPHGWTWLSETQELLLGVSTTQLPQALEITCSKDLLATQPTPILEATATQGERGNHDEGGLVLEAPDHLVLAEFWKPCPSPVNLHTSWNETSLVIDAVTEHPEGIPLQSSWNDNEDGLTLWWQLPDKETPFWVRVAPEPSGQGGTRCLGPDGDAEGVEGTFRVSGSTVSARLTIPADFLGHSNLVAGLEIPMGFAFRHSDRQGFRIGMAWTPGVDQESTPLSVVRLI